MGSTNFNPPVRKLVDRDGVQVAGLEVGGPFTLSWPKNQLYGPVTIRFLLIEDVDEDPAKNDRPPAIVDSSVNYNAASNLVTDIATGISTGAWSTDVDLERSSNLDQLVADGHLAERVLPGGKYRTIGEAIMIRRLDRDPNKAHHEQDPPFFLTLTWCVSKDIPDP